MGKLIQPNDLSARLEKAQGALVLSGNPVEACNYAQALLQEMMLPLEIVNNLTFLAHHDTADSSPARLYLEQAHEQLAILNQIALRSLRFCKDGRQHRSADDSL